MSQNENIKPNDLPKSRDAADWFRDQLRNLRRIRQPIRPYDQDSIKKDQEYKTKIVKKSIGRMYTFLYDPKYKEKLPFYDTFPLAIIIGLYTDGFLALNLHYLPPVLRIQLLNALLETANNKNLDETTRLKIDYEILKSASELKLFEPCVKRYLFSYMRSEPSFIDAKFWSFTVTLPTENFVKKSKQDVWKASLNRI